MKMIALTQGKVALVDDEDFATLNAYKWYAVKDGRTFYAVRHIPTGLAKPRQRRVMMHRVIANTPADKTTDHINGDGLDNRRVNLRMVTSRQNTYNQVRKATGKTSQFRGVSWHKRHRQWQVRIQCEGVRRTIGFFTCELEAAAAYDAAGKMRDSTHFTPNLSKNDRT